MSPQAEAPSWAISAGLPLPLEGEDTVTYARRLGLAGADDLLTDLRPGLEDMANLRLRHRLSVEMPEAYAAYIEREFTARLDAEQRARLRRWTG